MYREKTKENVPKHNSSYLWIIGLWIFLYFFCLSNFPMIICNFYNQRGKYIFFFKIMSNIIHLNQSQPDEALKTQMPTYRSVLAKQPSSCPCINIIPLKHCIYYTELYLLFTHLAPLDLELPKGTLRCLFILYIWHIK